MTKGEQLIWRLFEMVRELMPPTPANAERFTQWAAAFHELEHGTEAAQAAAQPAPETVAEPEELEDEPAEDPHEHGVPPRKRKKK